MKDILTAITNYRLARGWSEYQLAEKSELPQSTISGWYRNRSIPTLPSLERVCAALGVTLSQLFGEGEDTVSLTPRQRELLDAWAKLDEEKQALLLALIKLM